jgi:membrane protein YqaA with SNARE-associated domain
LSQPEADIWSSLVAYGYAGVFASSLLGSMIPFVSGPYIPPIILAIVAGRLDPAPTALFSALGASLGKLALYNLFRGGRTLLRKDALTRIAPLEPLLRKYGWFAILVTAATPVPDDLVYILIALSGLSNRLFFPFVLAGKLVITSAVAYLSLTWQGIVCMLVECGPAGDPTRLLALSLASAAVAMLLVYLVTRLNWSDILAKLGASGRGVT